MNDLFEIPIPLNWSGVLEFHMLNKDVIVGVTSTPLLVGVISHQHNIISRPPVDTNESTLHLV